jgi:hypothetical protein
VVVRLGRIHAVVLLHGSVVSSFLGRAVAWCLGCSSGRGTSLETLRILGSPEECVLVVLLCWSSITGTRKVVCLLCRISRSVHRWLLRLLLLRINIALGIEVHGSGSS